MNPDAFTRLVWSAVLPCGVVVWCFAIIGVRSVIADPPRLSIWTAAERPLP